MPLYKRSGNLLSSCRSEVDVRNLTTRGVLDNERHAATKTDSEVDAAHMRPRASPINTMNTVIMLVPKVATFSTCAPRRWWAETGGRDGSTGNIQTIIYVQAN